MRILSSNLKLFLKLKLFDVRCSLQFKMTTENEGATFSIHLSCLRETNLQSVTNFFFFFWWKKTQTRFGPTHFIFLVLAEYFRLSIFSSFLSTTSFFLSFSGWVFRLSICPFLPSIISIHLLFLYWPCVHLCLFHYTWNFLFPFNIYFFWSIFPSFSLFFSFSHLYFSLILSFSLSLFLTCTFLSFSLSLFLSISLSHLYLSLFLSFFLSVFLILHFCWRYFSIFYFLLDQMFKFYFFHLFICLSLCMFRL